MKSVIVFLLFVPMLKNTLPLLDLKVSAVAAIFVMWTVAVVWFVTHFTIQIPIVVSVSFRSPFVPVIVSPIGDTPVATTSAIPVVSPPAALRVPETVQAASMPVMVKATWYGVKEYCERFNPSCIMANGEKLDDTKYTAACAKRWKLGEKISVRYGEQTIIVECTDRGSFEEKYDRQLDLSKAAFGTLAPLSKGVITVEVH